MINFRNHILICFVIVIISFCPFAKCQEVLHSVDFFYEDANQLKVEGAFCNVEISQGEKKGIYFEGEILGIIKKGLYKIRYNKLDSVVKVWIEKPKDFIGTQNGKLKFEVSSDFGVKVTNTSGRVIIKDLDTKTINIKTNSGNINVSNVNSNINFTSSSGSLTLLDLTGDIFIRSGDGGQYLNKIKGNVKTIATKGKLILSNVTGNIDAINTGGEISLFNTNGLLTIQTKSAEIKGKHIEITGNSSIKSYSGNIDIQLLNGIENYKFNLRTNTGNLMVGKTDVGNIYIFNNGKLLIRGITDSGSQYYH